MFDLNKTKKYAKDLEKIIREAWIDQEVRVGLDGNSIILKHDSGEQYIINLEEYLDPQLKSDSDGPAVPKSIYISRALDASYAVCRCGGHLAIGQDKCNRCDTVLNWGNFADFKNWKN